MTQPVYKPTVAWDIVTLTGRMLGRWKPMRPIPVEAAKIGFRELANSIHVDFHLSTVQPPTWVGTFDDEQATILVPEGTNLSKLSGYEHWPEN